jgi:hypothetical protein
MRLIIAAVLTSALVLAAPAFAEVAFFRAMPDVPLPPGATEVAEPLSFETEQGRFTVSFAGVAMPADEQQAFYEETLPQLGWSLLAAQPGRISYARGRERLTLRFTSVEEGEIRIVAELTAGRASAALD